ncbi:DUF481 domain-containing protein [candidate division KSB1 bacterium]|nr:DUF481 domain-containing protein [candidate division KSB1 bacterium]
MSEVGMNLHIYFFIFLLSAFRVFGQVNTETLRKSDLDKGLHGKVQFQLGLNTGNSEYLKMKSNFRLDYMAEDYYSFGVVEYQRGLEADELFINKGFAHVRYIHSLLSTLRWELFAQKEFNDFILLLDRNLAGAGLRKSFILQPEKDGNRCYFKLHFGAGLMWENEEIDTDPDTETNIVRSTNYISIDWKIDDRLQLIHINYFQFDVENLPDYRVLAESTLSFSITKAFRFQTSLEFRYDNKPPLSVKKYDLELTNGVSFAF